MPSKKDFIHNVLETVEQREQAMMALFDRMEKDRALYNLVPFEIRKGEGIAKRDRYTTNRPQIVANKLIGAIAGAKRIIRVENDSEDETEKDINNNAERLAIGFLDLADRHILDSAKPSIYFQLGHFALVRGGFVAARALLRKDPKGETIVDVMPIDPRHLVFQAGDGGIIWAAIVTMRERRAIRQQYPKFKFEHEEDDTSDGNRNEKVVDYYWTDKKTGRHMNCVIIQEKYAKEQSDTFSARFPVIIRAVGSNPGGESMLMATSASGGNDVPGIRDFGESVFGPLRSVWESKNLVMSYRMALTSRTVRGVYKAFSIGGELDFDGQIDENSSVIPLDPQMGQDIKPLEMIELTKDTDVLNAQIGVDEADGSLPEQSYGRAPSGLSGTALRILGANIGERLEPFIRPVESCYEGIIEALITQYETGRYRPVRVIGKTFDRSPFNRVIEPMHIYGHGPVTVDLSPVLPEDDEQRYLGAQVVAGLQVGGEPVVSGEFIRTNILNVQDSDLEKQRIFTQMARVSTPTMLLLTQWLAAIKSGEEEVAAYLDKEITRLEDQKKMEDLMRMAAMMQALGGNVQGGAQTAGAIGPGPQPNGGTGTPPNPVGIDPRVAPLSGTVAGRPNPSPDNALNATGARNPGTGIQDRLAAIGLEFAR